MDEGWDRWRMGWMEDGMDGWMKVGGKTENESKVV